MKRLRKIEEVNLEKDKDGYSAI